MLGWLLPLSCDSVGAGTSFDLSSTPTHKATPFELVLWELHRGTLVQKATHTICERIWEQSTLVFYGKCQRKSNRQPKREGVWYLNCGNGVGAT